MTIPITSLLDAAVVALGYLFLGAAWVALLRRRKPADPKSICGCGHHLSFHDPTSLDCRHTRRGSHHRDCGCRRFTGPAPQDTADQDR